VGFHFSLGEYYGVPHREVVIIRERRIPDEEVPVVLFIARKARVEPAVIVDLRLSGRSWMDITRRYRLSPEVFYVPVKIEVKGPPYGKAYGHYRNRPRKEWGKIVLHDDDVINLVNLRFVSEHHGYAPEEVIRMRSGGKNFVVIHEEVRHGRRGRGEDRHDHRDDRREKNKGKKKWDD
jgi:hypothetical protein